MTTERVLRLDGPRNFRDLGGYPTIDGRRLKWGRLYRAGILGAFTQTDCEQLEALGLRAICDLRGTAERLRGPSEWSRMPNVTYWSRDYINSVGDLHALMKSDIATVDAARNAMLRIYRALPREQALAYRELFRLLAAGELPLVFNCSAGKDRTGLAAALVLKTLSVPEEIVLEDYLLSNVTFTVPDDQRTSMKCAPAVVDIIRGTDRSFLAAAFAAIDESFGSFDAYLYDTLQVTPQMLASIQSNLLEAAA